MYQHSLKRCDIWAQLLQTQGSQWKGGQELFPTNASAPGLGGIFRQAISALANSTSCDKQQTLQLVKLTAFIRPW